MHTTNDAVQAHGRQGLASGTRVPGVGAAACNRFVNREERRA
jgi:hypothetical protein